MFASNLKKSEPTNLMVQRQQVLPKQSQRSAGGAELCEPFICCSALGASGAQALLQQKTIIITITQTRNYQKRKRKVLHTFTMTSGQASAPDPWHINKIPVSRISTKYHSPKVRKTSSLHSRKYGKH